MDTCAKHRRMSEMHKKIVRMHTPREDKTLRMRTCTRATNDYRTPGGTSDKYCQTISINNDRRLFK